MEFKDKTTSNPHGVLAKLWRSIVIENNLLNTLDYLVNRYVNNTARTAAKNIRRKTKSTLMADITAKEMTWKKFTNLVFNYLGAIRMDITVKLTFPNGNKSYHTVSMVKADAEEQIKKIKEAASDKKDEK